MSSPAESVDDGEHEQVVVRVAAIDIGKRIGKVCTRLPHETKEGRRHTRVWDVPATTGPIIELADHLVCQGVERVVLESTSDYWRPFFYLLEARGLAVWLVNARDVKNVPGRPKTDKLDAVWLAKLAERGMLRPSFVPRPEIRRLRDLTRLRDDLTHERTRHKQRVEKILEDALIKLSTVLSDIFGVSGRAILDALVAGERDPKKLAALAHGRVRATRAELAAALTGQFSDHHAYLVRLLLDQVDDLTRRIDDLTARIDEAIAALPMPDNDENAPPPPGAADNGPPTTGRAAPSGTDLLDRLDEIPGISRHTAQVILAELGTRMAQFPTPGHLASWAKLAPRTIQSGATTRRGKTGKGNPYLRGALGEAASAAARTQTFLGARYRRLVKRRGKLKALVAVARSILIIVWQLLNNPATRYHDLGTDHHTTRINIDRRKRTLLRELAGLGTTQADITAALGATA
ncbi:IS110 family transposase [Frankia sp. CNm7]|uniref:IS110 family transposase n=1 Tax=Frankia nepalensis TaxID=1836974 RepID=A0A937R4X8_9ACTN|nr:IS110 family transposase [Frankia nepalensis]MBL7502514.1 IS110 family transposase [Frankia nepalensis]MBL7516482.1 IS110 family transposase [Frankia nepalensis]MBL7518126.1 IS110 family transposase [Frankia nepalensis]MBL7625833.1 IS110 family transposase [Frankia nepalensis]